MDTCHERRSWRNVAPAAARVALGLSKSVIVTLYLAPILRDQLGLADGNTYYQHPEQISSFALLYGGAFLALFALYLEFSGYCDVAAGIARLIGYRQIENFDRPWFATSMRDLWRRWHISLSFVLRDYVYIPLGGNRRHTILNLCITFGLVGLWHVPVPKWGLWGVVMGLMVAINQHWAWWMKRLDQTPTGRWAAFRRSCLKLQPLPRILAWLITMHAFVFSTTIFAGGWGALRLWRELLRRIWGAVT
jgi:alginate O-acetyltransferase complex protein AlgI